MNNNFGLSDDGDSLDFTSTSMCPALVEPMITTVTVPLMVVIAPLTSKCSQPPVKVLMTRTVSKGVAM